MKRYMTIIFLFVVFITASILFTLNTEGTDITQIDKMILANNFRKMPNEVDQLDREPKEEITEGQEFDKRLKTVIWDLNGKAPNISFDRDIRNDAFKLLLETENSFPGTRKGKTTVIKKMLIEYKIEY